MTCRPLPNLLFIRQMHAAEYSLEELVLRMWQCWFSAGQKGISAARRGETGEKVFLP